MTTLADEMLVARRDGTAEEVPFGSGQPVKPAPPVTGVAGVAPVPVPETADDVVVVLPGTEVVAVVVVVVVGVTLGLVGGIG